MSISIPPLENPKRHFLLNDSFCNISYDLNFSIFRKYMCKAGCQICYIQNDWLDDTKFKKHIPIHQGNQKPFIDQLLEFFSYFDLVSTIDDLKFVKDKHPDLFRFYQEYGEVFYLSSMTDNAIFRHIEIIERDIRNKGIREISISEHFLSVVNMAKLLRSLDRIQKHSKILKIKAILDRNVGDTESALALVKWCAENDVMLEKQLVFEEGITDCQADFSEVLINLSDARSDANTNYSESTAYTEEFGEIYPIQSEILLLMYDEFYGELKSATAEGRSLPFAKLQDFEPVSFLPKILAGKVADYRRYAESIQDKESLYYKYFKYVSDNLVIHPDFTFIPVPLMKQYSTYYKKLISSGAMVETPYGLVKAGRSDIKSIIEFKENEPNNI